MSRRQQTLNFVTQLYLRRQLPHYLDNITNNFCKKIIFKNYFEAPENKDVLFIKDIPRYLTVKRQGLPNNIK